MDDDDSTEALLVELIEAERVIDNAIVNLYDDERARGLSAVIGDILNINNDSDDPPFEHDAPSALFTTSQRSSTAFLAGKKKSSFFFPPPRKKTSHVLICSVKLAIHQF